MKKSLILFAISLLHITELHAYVFKWGIPLNDRLEIVKDVEVQVYNNSRIANRFSERNIIDLTCIKKERDRDSYNGVISVYRRPAGTPVYRREEKHDVLFSIDHTGRYSVPVKYLMPNLRHIPTFPEVDLKTGDTWTAQAELVISNFSVPFKLLMVVEYTLVAVKSDKGMETAEIRYRYQMNKILSDRRYPPDFPAKIIGQNIGTIIWDITNSRPVTISDTYRIAFIFMKPGTGFGSVEFHMNMDAATTVYKAITPKDKEKEKDDLKKELPGIEVGTNERGIVLRIGEVYFDFNSHRIKEESKKSLDAIAAVIKKKYPDREIIVEGHTDDVGKAAYNQRLSEKRAKSVAEYLGQGTKNGKLSYKGYGQRKPIAENDSAEGRRKNRRVEMIIKLH